MHSGDASPALIMGGRGPPGGTRHRAGRHREVSFLALSELSTGMSLGHVPGQRGARPQYRPGLPSRDDLERTRLNHFRRHTCGRRGVFERLGLILGLQRRARGPGTAARAPLVVGRNCGAADCGGSRPGGGIPAGGPAGLRRDGAGVPGVIAGGASGGREGRAWVASSRPGLPRPVPPGGGRRAGGQRRLHGVGRGRGPG